MVIALYPTNTVFNFQKANYRVPADVNGTNSPWAQVTIWVERFGTNSSPETINYRVNNFLGCKTAWTKNITRFSRSSRVPTTPCPRRPPTMCFAGEIPILTWPQGTLAFPGFGTGEAYQPLTFTVPVSGLTKFNKDFKIQLNQVQGQHGVCAGNEQ